MRALAVRASGFNVGEMNVTFPENLSNSIGMPIEFERFSGKVTFISPTLNPDARTAKARMEIQNPNLILKPESYGTARLFAELGERLTIPDTAVMRTGDHT